MLSLLIGFTKIINAFGLVQAITLSVILFVKGKQNKLNYFIALLLFVLAIIIGNTLIILGGFSNYIPYLQALANAVVFLLGPLIFILTDKGLGSTKPILSYWKHIIPFVIYLPFCFVLTLSSLGGGWLNKIDLIIILWLWNFQIFYYLIQSFQKLNKAQVKLKKDTLWLRYIVVGFLIISCLNLLLTIVSRFIYPIPHEITLNITVLLSFVVASIVYKAQSSPITSVKVLNIEKVEQSEINSWEENLEKLLVIDKVYKSTALSIATLAEKTGVNQRVLSEMINHKYGKNFNEFINEYRVKDVIEKMEDNALENTTILGLAEESGFKSNTAFYRAFKSYTGTTPKAYISAKSL